jgi:hypothetical protein
MKKQICQLPACSTMPQLCHCVLHILHKYKIIMSLILTNYSEWENDISRWKQSTSVVNPLCKLQIPIAFLYTLDYILIGPIPVRPFSIRHHLPTHNTKTPNIRGGCEFAECDGFGRSPSHRDLAPLEQIHEQHNKCHGQQAAGGMKKNPQRNYWFLFGQFPVL